MTPEFSEPIKKRSELLFGTKEFVWLQKFESTFDNVTSIFSRNVGPADHAGSKPQASLKFSFNDLKTLELSFLNIAYDNNCSSHNVKK